MSYFLYVAYNKSSKVSKIGRTSNVERRETELIGFSMVSIYEVSYSQAIHLETLVRRAFISCEGLEYFKDSPENISYFIGNILSKTNLYKYSKSPLISKACISFGSSIKGDISEDLIFSRSVVEDKGSYVCITHYSDNKIIAYTYADSIFRIIVNKGGYGTLYAENCIGNPVPYQIAEQFLQSINNFNVSSITWAMYIKCRDKLQAIDTLKMSYGRDVPGTELPRRKLCNLIGFSMVYDEDLAETGFLLIQKHHKNRVLTINFYDKAKSNLDKKTTGLSKEELEIVNNHLRLDITAHRPYLEHVFNKAKQVAKKLTSTKMKLKYLHPETVSEFAKQPIMKTTSRNLIISYILLSCVYNETEKKWYKTSFSRWLKKDILVDRLMLDKILAFGGKMDLDQQMSEWEQSIIKKWKKGEEIRYESSGEWKRLEKLQQKLNLNFKLPYRLLESIIVLDSVYGIPEKMQDRYVTLNSKKEDLTIKEHKELEAMRRVSIQNMRDTRLALSYDFGLNLSPPSANHELLGQSYG